MDPDICLRQLQEAKVSIANAKAVNDKIIATKSKYEELANEAETIYLSKKTAYEAAQTDVNNYKVNETKHVNCGVGCDWGVWPGGECNNRCITEHSKKYSDGATITGKTEWENCCSKSCSCFMPELGEYNRRVTVKNTKKVEMDSANADWLAKKKTLDEYLPVWATAPINVACCKNSIVCAPDSNCAKITQTCEAQISEIREKTAKEKDEEKKAAARKAAESKKSQEEEEEEEEEEEGKKVNTPLIGGGLFSCCFSIILVIFTIIIIIIFINK
jgi:hypothetical protein